MRPFKSIKNQKIRRVVMKNQVFLAIAHLLIIIIGFYLISLIPASWLWLRLSGFILFSLFTLINAAFLFFEGKGLVSWLIAKIMFGAGVLFSILFSINCISIIFVFINQFAVWLNNDFYFAPIFSKDYMIALSVPAFIAAASLIIFSGFMRDPDYEYERKHARKKSKICA